MTHVLFVHGTGVRDQSYRQTLDEFQSRLPPAMETAQKSLTSVSGVSWGEDTGTDVNDQLIEQMLPAGSRSATVGVVSEDPDLLRWEALFDDPAFELKILAVSTKPDSTLLAGQQAPDDAFAARLRKLSDQGIPPYDGLTNGDLTAALNTLLRGDLLELISEAALAAGSAAEPNLVGATADFIVATVLNEVRGEPGAGPDALYDVHARQKLVDHVYANLSTEPRGVGGWLQKKATDWVKKKATRKGRNNRIWLMDKVSPGMGDIIYSQRRGEAILDLLRQRIAALEGEVSVVGHSLGGVLLFDLLSSDNAPSNVSRLITVGSQSAYFGACDALKTLRLDTSTNKIALPDHFPDWLNIFDTTDFLSFCAERSFSPAGRSVTDRQVTSKVPFPDSHGAYWRNSEVYKAIAGFL